MRQPDDDARMLDMLVACRQARALAVGATLDQLLDDSMLQLALVKLIEIVGEAASHVTPQRRESLPAFPWRRIIGMRHRLVHDYGHTDYEIVWSVVSFEMAILESMIEEALGSSSSS